MDLRSTFRSWHFPVNRQSNQICCACSPRVRGAAPCIIPLRVSVLIMGGSQKAVSTEQVQSLSNFATCCNHTPAFNSIPGPTFFFSVLPPSSTLFVRTRVVAQARTKYTSISIEPGSLSFTRRFLFHLRHVTWSRHFVAPLWLLATRPCLSKRTTRRAPPRFG